MKLNRKNASFLRDTIRHWKENALLNDPQSKILLNDIEVVPFDWRRLAKYSMWISLICILTAIGAALADKILLDLLNQIFNASHILKCITLTLVSTALYSIGIRRKIRFPEKIYSNESILFSGIIATSGAIYMLGAALDLENGHWSLLLLLTFLIYGLLGFFFNSPLIWIFSLLSLGNWFGAETGYASGWGAYYLGMNYPLRFVLFGSLCVALTVALRSVKRFEPLFKTTVIMGLLFLFIALWILSIFGNYGDMEIWHQAKAIELLRWSVLFGLAAGAALYHSLRFDDGITRGFGITFLFINLYTRFFEYFWDSMHKTIFFGILGITFWWLGARAEKIWNLGDSPLKEKAASK